MNVRFPEMKMLLIVWIICYITGEQLFLVNDRHEENNKNLKGNGGTFGTT